MFDNTITLTRDGTAIVLSKINQDQYSSEYLFRDTIHELHLKFRHSKERLDPTTRVQMERHNYVLDRTVFATATTPSVLESASVTLRFQAGADPIACQKTALATLAFASAANITKLLAWES